MREAWGNKPDMMSEHEQNVKGLITIQLNNLYLSSQHCETDELCP